MRNNVFGWSEEYKEIFGNGVFEADEPFDGSFDFKKCHCEAQGCKTIISKKSNRKNPVYILNFPQIGTDSIYKNGLTFELENSHYFCSFKCFEKGFVKAIADKYCVIYLGSPDKEIAYIFDAGKYHITIQLKDN